MSLITDALGLRQGRSEKKITRQEKYPPFPKPPGQGREIQAIVLTLVLIALALFGYLRGAQLYAWLEGVVLGITTNTVPGIPASDERSKPFSTAYNTKSSKDVPELTRILVSVTLISHQLF